MTENQDPFETLRKIVGSDIFTVPHMTRLTQREIFAAIALNGILAAGPEYLDNLDKTPSEYAVKAADALIAELEK